jgi:hypothetical protein
MSRITRILVVAVFCVALAVPAVSAAKPGHRGFNHTFPIASRLCNHATNGHLPKGLQSSSAQVLAACATLHTAFTDAQNAYSTTVGPLQQTAIAALKTLRQTCRDAHKAHTPDVCKTARQATRTTIQGLRAQVFTAGKTYHASVEAARKAFWTTIHGLRGGATQPTDPSAGPAPSTAMPSDSAVNQS